MNIPYSMQSKTVKKILLVTHFLPPTHNAGTEQYTLGLGRALKARGYDVSLVCAEDWDRGKHYWNGVTQETLDELTVYRVHLNWLRARNPNRILYESKIIERWFDRFLSENRFDLVHVTSTYSLGVGVLRSVKRAKIPLILTLTDFWFLCPSLQLLRSDGTLCNGKTSAWECASCLLAGSHLFQRVNKVSLPETITSRFWIKLSRFPPITRQRGLRGLLLDMEHRKKIMQETFALPDLVISPSSTVQAIFAQNMPQSIKLLRHGHDLSWLKDYHGKKESDVIRFGYLGGIHKVKGVHLLIEAFQRAALEGRARLDIWGGYGTNKDYVQRLNSMIGHSSIILRGKYNRTDLANILSEIDVVVVPSIWYENAPLVIQEAFAANTPVIATNLGGMAETITHGVNGLLFERSNSDNLAKQMQQIVDDRQLLNKLSAGILRPRAFDEEIVKLDAIYNQLVEGALVNTLH